MPATVRLVNAVFYAHHGVMEEEHKVGGRFEVDVAMDLDIRQAATDDDLSKTVDYERVYAIVRDRVTGTPSYLIESLAYSIAEVVMQHFPMLLEIHSNPKLDELQKYNHQGCPPEKILIF